MTSDSDQNGEERLVEELLDRLNDNLVPWSESLDSATSSRLREYTEALGLLAYELDPVPPSASVEREILARLRREELGSEVDTEVVELAGRPVSRPRRWLLPLAAGLTFALLGVSGFQYLYLQEQRDTIERLADRLSRANRQEVQLADFQHQLERAQSKLALVTSRGVEVCTLHPVEAGPSETVPRGTLFVAADHQSWFLRIDGLEPCPLGRVYQLWFIKTDGSAETGGLLDVRAGVDLEMTSDAMPAGTVAVSITMEPAGGSAEPSGPSVLYGDEVMRIL